MASSERWQRIERLYHAALARDERDRAAFLRDSCGGDEDLLRDVETFLVYDRDSDHLLAGHALDLLEMSAAGGEGDPLIGRRFGPYEITAWLGSGGMGDVYRARDGRLGRDVAIKILPGVFAADSVRRTRFEREARVLASLNHPHIAAIYGFEDRDGIHALVLELVEGETLAHLLQRGPLPVPDAVRIAGQIAGALEAAHAKGIVHRDLKPRNIALTPEGAVKVLDFGLAKAALGDSHSEAGEPDAVSGVMLGTTPYMSPEQAQGRDIDARTDIWAFGCVLVEMLTGRPVFSGGTVADTISAIVNAEPDWNLVPSRTPPAIARLARQCLDKDRSRRLLEIADARREIERALRDQAEPGRTWRGWMAAGAVTAALAAIALAVFLFRPDRSTATRMSVSAPGSLSPQLSAAVSPDGRRLAFVATGASGRLMLFIRELDSLEPHALAGTEDAAHPFWSPDGRRLGFLADGKLRTIDAAGGKVDTLADAPERAGPSWSVNDQILFVSRVGELGIVPATGGTVSTVVPRSPIAARQAAWPFFLPDGRHFLFFLRSPDLEERGVYAGAIGSTETKRILTSEFKAGYADGHLLFVRDGALMAQPFDAERMELSGNPVRVGDGVWTAEGAGQASFSVSHTGVLAYVNEAVSSRQLAWLDRRGRLLEHVGEPARYAGAVQLDPVGHHIAAARSAAGGDQVVLLDPGANTATPLTFGPERHGNPVWAPDSARIALQVRRSGRTTLRVVGLDGKEDGPSLYESDRPVIPMDWSPDGRLLVIAQQGPASLSDLWLVPMAGDHRPLPFLQGRFNRTQAQISPDGQWIAYTSYESGADEVYVERFPSGGSKRQVSTSGGVQPRWRGDGRELFYLASDQTLMTVAVDPGGAGTLFRAGEPAGLFKLRVIAHGSQSIGLATLYDVAPDGQRFLSTVPADPTDGPITVVLNWTAALRRK